MNPQGRIPRRRGVVCGLLLVLLGVWGGLAPFVGPYFHFGYTPDTVWHYDTGRLYFSAVPGGAVVLGGLLAVATRNRGVGITGGLLAALGGAWFTLGHTFTTVVLKKAISVGSPILSAGATPESVHAYVETLTLFTGLGVLVAFLGAVVAGRFSMLAAADIVAEEEDSYYTEFPAAPSASFPSVTGDLPDTTTTLPPDVMR